MKNYVVRFGTGDPRNSSALSPTFIYFIRALDGQTIAPPGFSEVLTGSGLYSFQWGTTQAIAFLADGATSGLGNARYVTGAIDPADRADEYGSTLVAIGTTSVAIGTTVVALGTTSVSWGSANSTALTNQGSTLVAIGNTAITGINNMGSTLVGIGNTFSVIGLTVIPLIGTLGSTFGGSATDPIDLFGYMKRVQENLEGNQTFTKGTGAWQISSRGSSTVLANKTVSNGASLVTRS